MIEDFFQNSCNPRTAAGLTFCKIKIKKKYITCFHSQFHFFVAQFQKALKENGEANEAIQIWRFPRTGVHISHTRGRMDRVRRIPDHTKGEKR